MPHTTTPPPVGDLAATRRFLREAALARREALSAAARTGLTAAIERGLDTLVPQLAPRVLAFCWPWRAEPDLRAWVARWLAADAQRIAALPVVLDRGTPMVFRRWTPDLKMARDRHGIPHPAQTAEVVPDVALVPLNAFDAEGFRLGYGGGYFDRTLAVMDPVAVGVGFEVGRVATAHPQPHDKPMDWIVTEAGVFSPRQG